MNYRLQASTTFTIPVKMARNVGGKPFTIIHVTTAIRAVTHV